MINLAVAIPQFTCLAQEASAPTNQLRREGLEIAQVKGQIVRTGNRWALKIPNSDKSYRLLENLALQRVVHSLNADPTDRNWTIDGVFTEFSNENFIQISRAVRTSKVIANPSEISKKTNANDRLRGNRS